MKDINADGKFIDRLVPALIAASLAVAGMAIVFWSDTRANDRETATAIATMKEDIKDLRGSATADRQKQNELTVDVKVLLSIVRRIESRMERDDATRQPSPFPR
jgi:hypothetical protein